MTISNEVEQVLNKVNISELIGKYIEIHKKGNSYVSVCPFHDDSKPSLNISVDKNIFKCFACGVGGNAIGFVQKFKAISFGEALAEVANYVGVNLKNATKIKSKYSKEQEKVIAINNDTLSYFYATLFTSWGRSARGYLEERKIDLNLIRNFNIGFAKSKYELFSFLHEKRGYTIQEIENSALFTKKEISYRPVFFNRLMFPIKDLDGKVIGFSGRVIDNVNSPKYLNTSENIVFKKSEIAYNFDTAQNEIRKKDQIIILEGYMDVISMHGAGIKNVVAIMGTNMSDFHVHEFSKATKNFVLFLDGDKPGVEATIKIMDKLLSFNDIEIKVVKNKYNLDPDELISSGKKNEVENLINSSLSYEDFMIEHFKETTNDDKSSGNVDKQLELIFKILLIRNNGITVSRSLKEIASYLEVDISVLNEQFGNFKNSDKFKTTVRKNVSEFSIKNETIEFDNNFYVPDDYMNFSNNVGENGFVMSSDDSSVFANEVSEKHYTPELFKMAEASFKQQTEVSYKDLGYKASVYYFLLSILEMVEQAIMNISVIALLDNDYKLVASKISDYQKKGLKLNEDKFLKQLEVDKEFEVKEIYDKLKYETKHYKFKVGSKRKTIQSLNKIKEANFNTQINNYKNEVRKLQERELLAIEKIASESNEELLDGYKKNISDINSYRMNIIVSLINLIKRRGILNNGIKY